MAMPSPQRYSRLAPLAITQRAELAVAALNFFSPAEYEKMCRAVEKARASTRIEPFSGRDFIRYLETTKLLPEAERYSYKIGELLAELAQHGLLKEVGRSGDVLLGTHYYFLLELTSRQQQGILWLARALGPEFLYNVYAQATAQITGVTKAGDVHAGTGLVIAPNWLLTCAHVVRDMQVDDNQFIFGETRHVMRTLMHPTFDVGLVELEQPMPLLPGLAFRTPIVAEPVFTLGYPRIPLSRDATLVMQRGEVTNSGVTLLDGSVVFLYSAIARPGNSGGPILAETGHVVGIVTQELSEKSLDFQMPFHAGIQTEQLVRAISELGVPVLLPVESYE
jgi:hypothetical protein